MKVNHLNVHYACTRFVRVKKANGRVIFLPIIVLPLVVTKRVKVANELYKKTDGQLLASGRSFVTNVDASPGPFPSPVPTTVDVTAALDLYETKINDAVADPSDVNTRERDIQREAVLNILSGLGNYVDTQANSAGTDAVTLIELAGMRPKRFTNRRRQEWGVTQGSLSGTLKLTAAAIARGTHMWEYTTTPTDPNSWISLPATTRADILISGLTPATFVSCRHRTNTPAGLTSWEGHDPIVVI